ncbi:SME1-like protein [Saccharomyces kudriavzevii IFO 1802]|nr:SME1-like protein [Saccharomyces kudriavzevii IFO 1802]
MVPPINCIFNYLQQQTPVTIWLFEQVGIRIRGKIVGFDEFMNVVIDEAVEVPVNSTDGKEDVEKGTTLGRVLLKGDNITLITSID